MLKFRSKIPAGIVLLDGLFNELFVGIDDDSVIFREGDDIIREIGGLLVSNPKYIENPQQLIQYIQRAQKVDTHLIGVLYCDDGYWNIYETCAEKHLYSDVLNVSQRVTIDLNCEHHNQNSYLGDSLSC